MNQHTLAYLCSESGTLIQLKPNSIIQNFKSYNILLFYTNESKNLYNWIGKKAKAECIQQIENCEALILRMHPDKTVLRHISVKEQEKVEVSRMLEDIGIPIEDYKERMRLWREFEISIYSDIQKFRIEENNHLMLNKLEKAIETAKKIIELAQMIHDDTLVEEKVQNLQELSEKLEVKTRKNATLSEIELLVPKLKNCIQVKDLEVAVSLYNQITLMYKIIDVEPSNENKKVIDEYIEFFSDWEKEIS